ncbi:MAG: alcohol dehydrogenase catalytic domain-containing protein [Anaerolineales bacterium]
MTDKLDKYRGGSASLHSTYKLWPLYGAGLENLGKDGRPLEVPMPSYGPDELLIRHDACGLCFSDTKVIAQGQNHPRVFRDMQKEPVVLGHEVSMTIMGVGKNLSDSYKVGERLTLETDILVNGKTYAYGYWYQGGLSQYSVIGPEIYASDLGNNLIKVRPDKSYAEIALTEPWACVVAAYALKYRTGLKDGGVTWIIGAGEEGQYTISAGFEAASHPARLLLTDAPAPFADWLKERAERLGVEVTEVSRIEAAPVEFVDDIVLLGANANLIEQASPHLGQFGVMAILAGTPLERRVNIDVGRIHYHRWVYVGTTKTDVAAAYHDLPVRSNLKPGGRTWIVGAGGPMGRMHVQRAIEFNDPPAVILCTDVNDMRLGELCEAFADQAKAKGIQFICLNPTKKAEYEAETAFLRQTGFDDIVVLAPVPAAIADASNYLAPGGVMNVFAGVARGTMATLDLSGAYLQGKRVIGHSASLMSDFELVLSKTNSGELSPNRSVAAVGSLSAASDGLKAVKEASLAGKVVIYPNIKELPLTTLSELKEKLPTVYARLNARGEWTNAAEEEFLRQMLP